MEVKTKQIIRQIQNDFESLAFEIKFGFREIQSQISLLEEQIEMLKMNPEERSAYCMQSMKQKITKVKEDAFHRRQNGIERLIEKSRDRIKELN